MVRLAVFGVLTWLPAASTASADVQLRIQNGRVSLVAKDATPRQILTEWARIGQTNVVNVERVPGGPLTIELANVPEQQALDVVLRAVSGYLLAPRAVPASNLSRFDAVIVMPASVAPRVTTPTPLFQQPQLPPPIRDDEDDRSGPTPVLAPPRGPLFNTFPQPQVLDPQQQGAPSGGPGAPSVPPAQQPGAFPGSTSSPGAPTSPVGGSARPGEIVQPPPQPGRQPGAPPGRPANPEGN